MNSRKETTHAFIIRIWTEPGEAKDTEPIWRGVIEHVGSGARVYVNQLEQITAHLLPYIEAMGAKIDKPES